MSDTYTPQEFIDSKLNKDIFPNMSFEDLYKIFEWCMKEKETGRWDSILKELSTRDSRSTIMQQLKEGGCVAYSKLMGERPHFSLEDIENRTLYAFFGNEKDNISIKIGKGDYNTLTAVRFYLSLLLRGSFLSFDVYKIVKKRDKYELRVILSEEFKEFLSRVYKVHSFKGFEADNDENEKLDPPSITSDFDILTVPQYGVVKRSSNKNELEEYGKRLEKFGWWKDMKESEVREEYKSRESSFYKKNKEPYDIQNIGKIDYTPRNITDSSGKEIDFSDCYHYTISYKDTLREKASYIKRDDYTGKYITVDTFKSVRQPVLTPKQWTFLYFVDVPCKEVPTVEKEFALPPLQYKKEYWKWDPEQGKIVILERESTEHIPFEEEEM